MQIIIADPSAVAIGILAGQLERDGHKVYAFTNSELAVEYFQINPEVEAIIASKDLRPFSGTELAWLIRAAAGEDRPVYIIIMSGQFSPGEISEILDCGADEFIRKPPDIDEIHARLRSAQRQNLMQRNLIRLATTDPLTGALNRRAFFARLDADVETAAGDGLSAVMLDIDHFKRINDTFGHSAGDEVIKFVALEAMSETGYVGRLGGEEFALVLPGRGLEVARKVAERVQCRIRQQSPTQAGGMMSISCSFGVASLAEGEDGYSMLHRADQALYRAKQGGRDRVEISVVPVSEPEIAAAHA